jgi:hypothetical protein
MTSKATIICGFAMALSFSIGHCSGFRVGWDFSLPMNCDSEDFGDFQRHPFHARFQRFECEARDD